MHYFSVVSVFVIALTEHFHHVAWFRLTGCMLKFIQLC